MLYGTDSIVGMIVSGLEQMACKETLTENLLNSTGTEYRVSYSGQEQVI